MLVIFLGVKYIFLVLMLLYAPANAQKNPGPRSVGMGSGGTAVQGIWSLQQNPAGTAGSERTTLSVAYEQHLLDQELSTQTALFVFPYHQNVFGFSFERYGLNEYTEQNAGLSCARRFGDSFRLAIGLRYYQLNISQYGSAKAFSVEAGLQLNVTDKFIIASHIANPGRSRYENLSGSNLPVKLSFGASYQLSDRILMTADIRKLLNYPLDFMTGVEYDIVKWFSLRGGVSVSPFKQYTGFGLNYNKVRVDFAVASHPSLGYSPQISLGYEF